MDECIECKGKGTSGNGYKSIVINGKRFYAHRLVAMLFHGLEIQDIRSIVLHSCDNPCCINPQHLSIGTAKDNIVDCITKGRFIKNKGYKGDTNPNAKLTWEDVRSLRSMRKQGVAYHHLAIEFGISPYMVSNICRGLSWVE